MRSGWPQSILQYLVLKTRSFQKDESGVVLVLVTLLMTALVGVTGFAIDYACAHEAKSQLQRAADAAALSIAHANTEEEAQTSLQAYFNANVSQQIKSMAVVPTLVSWQSGRAQVSISATIATPFNGIFGLENISFSVSAKAVQSYAYYDFYAAVDMSGSLSIASDATNRAKLQALTGGCEFACHQLEGGQTETFYSIAKRNHISLREDVLNAVFSDFISAVLTTNPDITSRRRVDVLGFSGRPGDRPADMVVDLTQGLTDNPDIAHAALSKFPENLKVNTYLEYVLPQLKSIVGPQGNGFRQDSPKKMLVLITDGVRSDRYNNTYPIENPIDGWGNALPSPRDCEAIKDAGIVLAVIDVKYVYSDDYWFWYWLGGRRSNARFTAPPAASTVYSEISPALQTCASQDAALPNGRWYFSATDTSDINAALTNLLEAVNKSSLKIVQ